MTEYYLKNREKLIRQAIEARRKRLGRVIGKRKNPWDNPEYREKMKLRRPARYWLGKKASEETRRKQSEVRKGKSATWNIGRKLTEEHKAKIVKSLIGNQRKKGKPQPPLSFEMRQKMSAARKGELSVNWQGGITAIQNEIRNSLEYRLWREAVFERDDYTCVCCGAKFIKGVTGRVILHVDHIKSFSEFPELRFEINNGRTLCYDCHRKTPTWGGRTKFKRLECPA